MEFWSLREDWFTELMVLGVSVQHGGEGMIEQSIHTLLGQETEMGEVESVSYQSPLFFSKSPLFIRIPIPLDSATDIQGGSSTLVNPLERSMQTYIHVLLCPTGNPKFSKTDNEDKSSESCDSHIIWTKWWTLFSKSLFPVQTYSTHLLSVQGLSIFSFGFL